MQKITISILLGIFIVIAAGLLLAPGVLSQGTHHHMWNNTTKKWNIDESYSAIKVTGVTNTTVTYEIMNAVMKDKDGKVYSMDFAKPLSGKYFLANNTIIVSKGEMSHHDHNGGKMHHNIMKGDYSNATIKVAGASAVIAKKDIKVLKQDKNSTQIQFSGIGVYLPDGTVKNYKLSTPVVVTMARGTKEIKVVATAELKNDLMDALKGSAHFPANAAPVPLKKIDGK